MSYLIIGDSCTDLTKEWKQNEHIRLVPLSIEIDGKIIVDDETFDQASFLRKMKASPNRHALPLMNMPAILIRQTKFMS